ncbi:17708_t:CDS:2, partial [Gigaspora rosea]
VANSPEQMKNRLRWTLAKLKIGGLKPKPNERMSKSIRYTKSKGETNIYLSFPDPNKPFFMECDASQHGIGAILYQEDENREHYK